MVELTGNTAMSGTFGYEATEDNNQNSDLCKTVAGGLRILNMNNLGLSNLAIPDCLLGPQSTLEEVRLGELLTADIPLGGGALPSLLGPRNRLGDGAARCRVA